MSETIQDKNGAQYPFPCKEECANTLSQDFCYKKIPEEDRQGIIDMAWNLGEEAAKEFLHDRENQTLDFVKVFEEFGIELKIVKTDFVTGNTRYFADIQPKLKTANLYVDSVKLWAESNGFAYNQAKNLILMHEFFHYLEYTKYGQISKMYQVPMLILGPIKLGKTGIAALSEIAANAFAINVYPQALLEAED